MDRRRFLALRPGPPPREMSCETLYMRLVDARAAGTTAELLARIEGELAGAEELRLKDGAWLERGELKQQLEPAFESFRARGGRISVLPSRS